MMYNTKLKENQMDDSSLFCSELSELDEVFSTISISAFVHKSLFEEVVD